MYPALSGSMAEKTREASGAQPRWMLRGFMSMVTATMVSAGLTVLLTACLSLTFLGQMLGLALIFENYM